ncbi:Cobalt uptake substrate-specific transmembrane region [Loktanella fryxellensis]|uniref:Cobalt uptake substrate-specific transmembrane region n=1 Tax=Loktanella fryxellensis TaxID=245187 RepID=A0A1H8B0P7_9RHOB|nr:energy-coupling factor ABC transporter permease [Loktanella fryxellensis]SEM75407.1 Cobalt uptake substrate-specific transmembrane region [Loktanella fryxellensis]
MHIEPGVVTGAKLALGTFTAAGAATVSAKLAWETLRDRGALSLLARSAMATAATVVFFELLPHVAVGPSEVHLILGSTLLLMLGTAPAAIGLALGLLLQGLLMAPFDLPQYGMNVTTLLMPLLALHWITRRVVARGTAYVDLTYVQALKLSTTYQAGIVAWVAFWVLWGQGASMATLASLGTFGAAYMTVVLAEPLVDLAVLALAKRLRAHGTPLLDARVYG